MHNSWVFPRCRTIGDAIFVHIVTSRVYITFMIAAIYLHYIIISLSIYSSFFSPLWGVIVLLAIFGAVMAFTVVPLFQSALDIAVWVFSPISNTYIHVTISSGKGANISSVTLNRLAVCFKEIQNTQRAYPRLCLMAVRFTPLFQQPTAYISQ